MIQQKEITKTEKVFLLIYYLISGAVIISLMVDRRYFTYGTEIDFIRTYMPEAKRFISGEPLLLLYHPPIYPIILGIAYLFSNDWFFSGIIISLTFSFVATLSGYLFFRSFIGIWAGWGVLFLLFGSAVFISYGVLATSDMFFFAIGNLIVLVAYYSLFNRKAFFLLGALASIAILSRSNGITFALVAIIPLHELLYKKQAKSLIYFFLGIFIPLLSWGLYAAYCGSSFSPRENHINLALTYFTPGTDHLSIYARELVSGKFNSLWEVLSYDPIHILKTYIHDLYDLPKRIFFPNTMMSFPLNLFVIPGLILLLIRANKITWIYLLIIIISQALVTNLKTFESRYYLFVLPLLGASLGVCAQELYKQVKNINTKRIVSIFFIGALIVAFYTSYQYSFSKLHMNDDELHDFIPKMRNILNKDSIVIARRPHIGYYTDATTISLEKIHTFDDIIALIQERFGTQNIYIYYGPGEKDLRPEWESWTKANSIPNVFTIVETGDQIEWVLLKYIGSIY